MEAVQDPNAGINVEEIAQENARLRAQLLSENERLRAALAASQAENAAAQGLTDEDVRRLEHPEEFVAAENEEFRTLLADLQGQLNAVHAANKAAGVDTGSPAASAAAVETAPADDTTKDAPLPADPFAGVSDDELQAALDKRKAAGV